MAAEHIPNTAIWGDGAGTTFRATADAIHNGIVNFEIPLVLTTDPEAGILNEVREVNAHYGMDIEAMVIDGKPGKRQTTAEQTHLLNILEDRHIDNLTLMGCMIIIGEVVVEQLNGEVPDSDYPTTLEEARELLIPGDDEFGYYLPDWFPESDVQTAHYRLRNIHPTPTVVTANTHGLGAHLRVIALRLRKSAQTLHVVGKGIDTGPTVAANKFPVRLPPLDASEEEAKIYAKRLKDRAQSMERTHIPVDLEEELIEQQRLRAAAPKLIKEV